jgi:V/A-type H+/Na+-transporting ATPase subunit E
MDELRSSDALEKEIREDSRKKAERMLKQAEEAAKRCLEEGAAANEAELEALRAEYAKKAESYREEAMARLPMDKKRKRIEWAQRRLEAALGERLKALDSEGLLALMSKRLREAAPHFSGKECSASARGLEPEAAARALARSIPGMSAPQPLRESGGGRGLSLSTADGRVRFEADEDSIKEELLDKSRRELVEALLGKVDRL